MRTNGTVIVAGSVAQRHGAGGHTWVFLQYLLGLKRLGWDSILVDRLEAPMCLDEHNRPCEPLSSANLRYLLDVVARFGLEDSYAIFVDGRSLGIRRSKLLERARHAAALLNFMGFLNDEELLASTPRRVFVDIDPGVPQIWRELGLADVLSGHDDYVTVGEHVGASGCTIPDCDLEWIATPQPVVLDEWPAAKTPGRRFTSVCAWRDPFGRLEHGGRTYGQRVHEFRKFIDLPARTGADFELALDIHPDEARDLVSLSHHGWNLVDPRRVAGDPDRYREYVRASRAEIMVARGLYVTARSGWFSDRSICYLASGRPVLAQDTGFSYPAGEGLLRFSTPDEAAAGVEAILTEPSRHARAARELAEAYFDSDAVLTRLLGRLGVA